MNAKITLYRNVYILFKKEEDIFDIKWNITKEEF